MIRELADVLGISEESLHDAIWQAASRSSHPEGGVTVSWARKLHVFPGSYMLEARPDKNSVTLIYGASEKVAVVTQAAEVVAKRISP